MVMTSPEIGCVTPLHTCSMSKGGLCDFNFISVNASINCDALAHKCFIADCEIIACECKRPLCGVVVSIGVMGVFPLVRR